MLKTSKGLTPVVATVLLLMIAVAAVGSAAVFLDDTITSIGESIEEDLALEERRASTDITIDYGYRSTGGTEYVLIDVRNTGSETLEVQQDGEKLWNMYIDGQPQEWSYVDSDLESEDEILRNPNEVISVNTTEEFPDNEEMVEISLNAPYQSSDSYVCFNDGGNSC